MMVAGRCAEYRIKIENHVSAATRDGPMLYADIYCPAAGHFSVPLSPVIS